MVFFSGASKYYFVKVRDFVSIPLNEIQFDQFAGWRHSVAILTRPMDLGRGMRRRPARGKCGPRPPAPFAVLPLAPFQPDQKTVASITVSAWR